MSANGNGNAFENFVENTLRSRGYQKIGDAAWLFNRRIDKRLPKGGFYAREVCVGDSAVKGKKRRVEFFLIDQEVFPDGHLIECKWQEVPGSAEDKLFRLPLDIQKTGIPTTVVLDGEGFSLGIIEHLRSQVDKRIFRALYTMSQFQMAVNRGYLNNGNVTPMIARSKAGQPMPLRLWEEEGSL